MEKNDVMVEKLDTPCYDGGRLGISTQYAILIIQQCQRTLCAGTARSMGNRHNENNWGLDCLKVTNWVIDCLNIRLNGLMANFTKKHERHV